MQFVKIAEIVGLQNNIKRSFIMYCIYCGRKIEQENTYCPNCGKPAYKSNNSQAHTTNTNVPQKTSGNLSIPGIISTIIGIVCGLLSICALASNGRLVGYDSWRFTYGGGMTLFIIIGIISVICFIVGIALLITQKNK